ncbi:MAG: hypothetical protein UFB05_04195 [[Eubacterium] siraeum]|nr:hypothetical protein [[Eubacterium] siraeum]
MLLLNVQLGGIAVPNHFCPDDVWIVLFGRLLCPPVPCAPTLP